ncbi:uncharacterized protein GBIM_03833 [Gryllus bimaculatus]|nr:uncharacterized protein GBIM_03833 [Gryllus bimaculatus]
MSLQDATKRLGQFNCTTVPVGFPLAETSSRDLRSSHQDEQRLCQLWELGMAHEELPAEARFEKRNGSTRSEVVHDAIQVANIADLYFRTLNTRVSVVYIETWQGTNQAPIDKSQDISRALLNFNDYTSRKLFKVDKDTTQLLTGETFQGGESGMAVPETVCTAKSVGISVDINTYEPHLLAGTMAHMIGHNIGMGHDDGREECYCRDWHGCIMAQSIVGQENVQPYKFSECSRSDYIDALRIGHGICLLNKPNEANSVGWLQLEVRRTCGNSIVEDGEDCDCGTIDECHELDPCCDPITCKLTKEAECASGPCCNNCRILCESNLTDSKKLISPQLRSQGVICRDATNECDLPERCSGETGQCPLDIHKKNGIPCGTGSTGYCFNGLCPTLNIQCEQIWGYGGIAADKQCFDQFNSKGSINGHCGIDTSGQYVKCEPENVHCGSLQCQLGNRYPVVAGNDQLYSRTIISIKGVEYECKATNGIRDTSDMGLVRDGTPCGENLVCKKSLELSSGPHICVNQTCTSIFPHIDQGKCPSNHNNLECSGHGVCSNINKCYCEPGWSGADCSIQMEVTVSPLHTTATSATQQESASNDLSSIMTKKETPYGGNNNNLSTLSMVFILVGVVKGVFICFALMAVCYRELSWHQHGVFGSNADVRGRGGFHCFCPDGPLLQVSCSTQKLLPVPQTLFSVKSATFLRKSTMPKYDSPYAKKPMMKKYATKGPNRNPEEAAMESVNKILTFGSMPSYREHKIQQMKRMGSGSEEDATHSGDETVSFIDLPPNNLSKLPEKGILKKSGPYGTVMGDVCKEKWSEDSQSDNQEIMSQSDNNLGPDMMGGGGGAISEVERTLKSLNGYHEDILEALRTAASHRGTATPSGSSSLLSEEIIRKSLAECSGGSGSVGSGGGGGGSAGAYGDYKRSGSQEKICDGVPQTHTVMVEGVHHVPHHSHHTHHPAQPQPPDEDEEDEVPPSCGPIRIRNLEDLIRQLEHHSARHMSPSGSEDIRMSETEADRHYRLESATCSEPQTRCRGREEEPRFVYGRYRHPTTTRHPPTYHQHHMQEEESIYETADHDRSGEHLVGDTPDSESDEFIQAQQQLVRSASEEALPVTAKLGSSYERGLNVSAGHHSRHMLTHPQPPTVSPASLLRRADKGRHGPQAGPRMRPTDAGAERARRGRRGGAPRGAGGAGGVGGAGGDGPRRSLSEDSAEEEDNDSSRETAASSSVSGTEQTALLRPKRYPEYKH